MTKRWRIAEPCPPDFATTVAVEPIVAQLLWNRGLRTKEAVETFFDTEWERGTHDPEQFRHMPGAIKRVFDAIEKGEHITVHGDYDADGVTGSALLMTTLREIEQKLNSTSQILNSKIDFYIPHRDKEGYGLHRETVGMLKERGTQLIITVDCGIACVDEIALAKAQGMETIVVDHHEFGETIPDGYLIHPGLPEETYPFKKLAAVGVSYKFACALLAEARRRGLDIPEGWEKWLLDLVAIATVTDMVPLVGENRILQTYGLRVLNKTRRLGLRVLIESAGLTLGSLDTESVGFGIGPRINAAGRMDHASLALRLLLSESQDEARELAKALDRCNRERQETTRKMMVAAEKKSMDASARALFFWDKDWQPALVGLVAGKFADRFARPSIVVGQHEGTWIGSGRSIPSYNIAEAMREVGEGILSRVGGHAAACGFSLKDEALLPELARRLTHHASERLNEQDLIPELVIDGEIGLDQVHQALVDHIATLEPFGEGNKRPVFVSRGCLVTAADAIGSTKNHLRLTLIAPNGRRVKALGFKQGDRLFEIKVGETIDLVYHVAVNEWQGMKNIECRIIDFVCTTPSAPTVAREAIQVPQALAS
ncbi:single-stranded-DNA-specific exonuclease RecJ [Candidatus Uhrbacteria bacterium]|nr:single-stranded-DNA-specific exonuclease RecJ [Candidatus Uhrbacteria bacterium]